MYMAEYEANKIIQLLQFCSWKTKTDLTNKGLSELCAKLGNLPDGNELIPNERYLIDLMSDATIALKDDNIITRRKSYIDLLLYFAGFDLWKDWEAALFAAHEYISIQEQKFPEGLHKKLCICIPKSIEKQLYSVLTGIRKLSDYPLELITCEEKILPRHLEFVLTQLQDFQFVIWTIPLSWKNELEQNESSWDEIMNVDRLIPIWIDEQSVWDTQTPFIPWLKNQRIISGLPGILTTLLYIQEITEKSIPKKEQSAKEAFQSAISQQQNFHNSRGVFLQGNIQNQTNTIMGDINQTINNNLKDL